MIDEDGHKLSRRFWYVVIVMFVGMIALGVVNLCYTNRVDRLQRADNARAVAAQREAQEKLRTTTCALVLSQIQSYQETPPTNATGANLRDNWLALAGQLDCN